MSETKRHSHSHSHSHSSLPPATDRKSLETMVATKLGWDTDKIKRSTVHAMTTALESKKGDGRRRGRDATDSQHRSLAMNMTQADLMLHQPQVGAGAGASVYPFGSTAGAGSSEQARLLSAHLAASSMVPSAQTGIMLQPGFQRFGRDNSHGHSHGTQSTSDTISGDHQVTLIDQAYSDLLKTSDEIQKASETLAIMKQGGLFTPVECKQYEERMSAKTQKYRAAVVDMPQRIHQFIKFANSRKETEKTLIQMGSIDSDTKAEWAKQEAVRDKNVERFCGYLNGPILSFNHRH